MPHVLAIDQGTTSSRAIVFDDSGAPVAVAQREFTQHLPRDGWVEHDAMEVWATQSATIAEAMSRAGLRRGDLRAVGITNQRETTVVWDRATGRPIHHAIVWQDRRTAGMIDRIKRDGHEATIAAKTGLVADAYFSASKVAWLLEHVPDARDRAERGELAFGTIDSWMIWRLTDGRVHATDATNASRTMLYDIHRGQWDDELLAMWGVPRSMLPEVCDSSGVIAEASSDTPLAGVPIAGIAGDQQAATFGQLCVERGMTKTTYGTGCFMLMSTGEAAVASTQRLLTTIASRIAGRTAYALEGAVFIGGAVVQWLRDGLKLIRSAGEVEKLAASERDNGGVYLVPAFVGLGAPHWDPYARGVMCGLTRGATAGHVARAALESIAFQVADLMDAMSADSGLSVPAMRVDGGAVANDLLMQMQADLLQTAVERPAVTETTALGAAYLAGLAVGMWPSMAAIGEQRRVERTFEPAIGADEAASRRAAWAKAVERARGWVDAT